MQKDYKSSLGASIYSAELITNRKTEKNVVMEFNKASWEWGDQDVTIRQ